MHLDDSSFIIAAFIAATGIVILSFLKGVINWLRIRAGRTLIEDSLQLKLPAIYKVPLQNFGSEKIRIVLNPENCGTDCLGGKICLSNPDGTERITLCEFKEPEPLLSAIVTERSVQYWVKGTGRLRAPIIIAVPGSSAFADEKLLTLELQWNFLGTRLQRLLPLTRVIELSLFVKAI